jgi:hypothetical protein
VQANETVDVEANETVPELASGQVIEPCNNGLADVVNDIAFRFWKCLSMYHNWEQSTNKIHCRSYFHYGHKEKSCFNKTSTKSGRWIP